jgi:GT2 family glycosyltransferase
MTTRPVRDTALAMDVIVVSWNTRELLKACLLQLLGEDVVRRVIVVDNGSHDGSATMVAAEFPQVVCIAERTNHGFAGGNNIGLRVALQSQTAPYICCLNPDTVVQRGALQRLATYLQQHPAVVGVGPQLRYGDGSWQSSRRRFPTLLTYLTESTPLAMRWPRNPWRQAYLMADAPIDTPVAADWLVGAALVVRSERIRAVGLYDAAFALYSEELEWQRRLAGGHAGTMVYLPSAVVEHYEGQSSKQIPTQRLVWFVESRLRDAQLAHGTATRRVVQYGLMLQYAFEWCIEAAKWLLGHKRSLRRERVQMYGQVVRALVAWRMRPAQIW